MTATIGLQEPLVIGNRRIYPVVAATQAGLGEGFIASTRPLALIIEEAGVYSVTLLEGDSVTALLENLSAAYR